MVKDIKDYENNYADIPESYSGRIRYLLSLFKPKDFKKISDTINRIKSIKKKSLYFIFYMVPKATPRARIGRFKVFYVKDASFNSDLFKSFIEQEESIKDIISTPCKIRMDAYFPPKGLNNLNTLLGELRLLSPISIPDVDNIAKTYMDMIQKHLLLNDSLVVDLRVRKFYSIKPRIELSITYMEEHDSKYNSDKVSKWKQ